MKKTLITLVFVGLLPNITMASENSAALDEVLSAQPAEVQARYTYRHSKETIEFFGIKPGMTVVEGLPGGECFT